MFLFLLFTLFLCHFIFLRSSVRTKYRDPNTLYYLYHVVFYQLHFTCVLTVMYFFVHLDVYDSVRFVHI